ncbi:hypothetical protein HDU86_006119 [Geranomyces michiganensis]|nr:hypothetical protein HDU86_006119 [Geranomyces michiganensis]
MGDSRDQQSVSVFDDETTALLQQNLGEYDFDNGSWDYWSAQTFPKATMGQLDVCVEHLKIISYGFSKVNCPKANTVSLARMLQLKMEKRRREEEHRQQLRRDLDKTMGIFVTTLEAHSSYIKNRSDNHEQHLFKGVLDAWLNKDDGSTIQEASAERRALWERLGEVKVDWDGVFERSDSDTVSLVVNLPAKKQRAEAWVTKKDQHRFLGQFAVDGLIVVLGYEVLPKNIDFQDVVRKQRQSVGDEYNLNPS